MQIETHALPLFYFISISSKENRRRRKKDVSLCIICFSNYSVLMSEYIMIFVSEEVSL